MMGRCSGWNVPYNPREPTGEIKANRGYERFRRRGINKAILEIALISCGFNLHKYHLSRLAKEKTVKAAGWISQLSAEEKRFFSGCGWCTHFLPKSYPRLRYLKKADPFCFQRGSASFLRGYLTAPSAPIWDWNEQHLPATLHSAVK